MIRGKFRILSNFNGGAKRCYLFWQKAPSDRVLNTPLMMTVTRY